MIRILQVRRHGFIIIVFFPILQHDLAHIVECCHVTVGEQGVAKIDCDVEVFVVVRLSL